MTHRNAPLSVEGRKRLIERCKTRPIAHVAAEMGISRSCASKWANRYRRFGELGLFDRASAPRRQPAAIDAEIVAKVEDSAVPASGRRLALRSSCSSPESVRHICVVEHTRSTIVPDRRLPQSCRSTALARFWCGTGRRRGRSEFRPRGRLRPCAPLSIPEFSSAMQWTRTGRWGTQTAMPLELGAVQDARRRGVPDDSIEPHPGAPAEA
jgi:leucine-zipper of insertion element IS481